MAGLGDQLAKMGVRYTDAGEQVFTDHAGRPVSSQVAIAAFRLTPQYRETEAQARADLQRRVAKRLAEEESEYEALISLHLSSPGLLTRTDFETALASLELTLEKPLPYQEPRPTTYQVQLLLEAEAKEKLTGAAFWEQAKRRGEYVEWHFEARMAKELQRWEERRTRYEAEEAATVARENQMRTEAYEHDKARLEAALAGESTSIEADIAAWVKTVDAPYAFSAAASVAAAAGGTDADADAAGSVPTNIVHLRVSLPDRADLPHSRLEQLKNGGIRERQLTPAELGSLHADTSLSLCGHLVANTFNASPTVTEVRLDAFERRPQLIGPNKDVCVVSGIVTREAIDATHRRSKSPRAYATRIGLEFSASNGGELRPVGTTSGHAGNGPIPKIELPKLEMPAIELPKIELPEVALPEMGLPEIALPEIGLPNIFAFPTGKAEPSEASSGEETEARAESGEAKPDKTDPGETGPDEASPSKETPDKDGSSS